MNWQERFWSKVQKSDDPDGCWMWTASMRAGATFRRNGKMEKAYRISWEIANESSIPDGLDVIRKCKNSACVRPDHLFVGKRGDIYGGVRKRLFDNVSKCENGCWEWIGHHRHWFGYGIMSVDGKQTFVHRISWELHSGKKIPSGMVIRHLCHNVKCINPGHLEVGTQLENIYDTINAGRSAYGERQGLSKLSNDDVVKIRKLRCEERLCVTELASKFNVKPNEIYRIITGDRFRRVGGPIEDKTGKYGSEHHNSQLTDDEIRQIKQRFIPGEKFRTNNHNHISGNAAELAAEFRVSQTHIYRIVTGKAWSHVK